jgi:hypothetical protein
VKTLKNQKLLFSLMFFLFLIVGCTSGPTPEELVYEKLEEVVALESDFKEQQNPLVELEQQEKSLYDEIISLSMKEFDKIVQLSDEAISVVEEREVRIENEYESIKASKAEFDNVNEIIETIEDEKLKTEAKALTDIMDKRYSAYEHLYTSYKQVTALDKELYGLFKNKDLSLENLQEKIETINTGYDGVMAANDDFNNQTERYNEAKVAFYKNAGLDVVYKEETE